MRPAEGHNSRIARLNDELSVRPGPKPIKRYDVATYEPPEVNVVLEKTRSTAEWIAVIGVAVAFALMVKIFVAQAFVIPSESMTPTLLVHDRVIVNKLSYDYGDIHRGDVVVFKRPPGETDTSINDLIKRVIGLPGDTIEAKDGVLYRNGEIVDESYLPAGTITEGLPLTTVPQGQVWLMGDNRDNSSDSRVFGPVDEDLIVGKAEARIWPLSRLGTL